jgi:hypothetical protein
VVVTGSSRVFSPEKGFSNFTPSLFAFSTLSPSRAASGAGAFGFNDSMSWSFSVLIVYFYYYYR